MNIFRQAAELLKKKDAGGELSEEEFQLIATAELPLMMRGCPLPEDMPIGECLEKLAQIVEGRAIQKNLEPLGSRGKGSGNHDCRALPNNQ